MSGQGNPRDQRGRDPPPCAPDPLGLGRLRYAPSMRTFQ